MIYLFLWLICNCLWDIPEKVLLTYFLACLVACLLACFLPYLLPWTVDICGEDCCYR